MRKVRENILVAGGNQKIFPAGHPVFVCPSGGDSFMLNGILDKQLVFFDYKTKISVGPGVEANTVDRLVIGVGVDTNNDGVADTLRLPFGDYISGCNIKAAAAEGSACGTPEIKDLFFKCISCDENFTINITVEDDTTQAQFPYNRASNYTYTVNTGCCGCDTCDDGIDCFVLACKFVQKINADRKLPFTAHVLHGGHETATQDFCLDPVDVECGGCLGVPAITGVKFTHPIDGPVEVEFPMTVSPANEEITLEAQLPRVVGLINQHLGSYGSAALTSAIIGAGAPCCSKQLQVNTCIEDFELIGADGPLEACQAYDPFTAEEVVNDCPTCDSEIETFTPKCGVRFIAKPVEIDCECDTPPGSPKGWLGRNINVFPTGGFSCGAAHVREVQKSTLPKNLGYDWITRDAISNTGGMGREHGGSMSDPGGRWGTPRKNSRAKSSKVNCKAGYCSYAIEHVLPYADQHTHGNLVGPRGRTIVLIEVGDTDTRLEFEAIINPYLLSTSCPIKTEIHCGILVENEEGEEEELDQDQIENSVDDDGNIVPGEDNVSGNLNA